MMDSLRDVEFCSGMGKRFTLIRKVGAQYPTISYDELTMAAAHPSHKTKDEARWFIPSGYRGHDARRHRSQLEANQYQALVVDVDDGSPTLEALNAAILAATGEQSDHLIYSTSSSTPDARKYRAVIPLATTASGRDWKAAQHILSAKLADCGIQTDSSAQRLGQVSYCPNTMEGRHYERHRHYSGAMFNLESWRSLIAQLPARTDAGRSPAAAGPVLTCNTAKHSGGITRGPDGKIGFSVNDYNRSFIQAFNGVNPLDDLLSQVGYTREHPASQQLAFTAPGERELCDNHQDKPRRVPGLGQHERQRLAGWHRGTVCR